MGIHRVKFCWDVEIESPRPVYVITPSKDNINLDFKAIQNLKDSKAFLIINEDIELVKWYDIRDTINSLLKDVPYENVVILALNVGFNLKYNSFLKDDCPYKVFHKNLLYSHFDRLFSKSSQKVNKHFTCLMGTDRYVRRYILYLLKKGNLLSFGHVSHNRIPRQQIDDSLFINTLKTKMGNTFEDYLKHSTDIITFQDDNENVRDWGDELSIYEYQSCISLVCETAVSIGSIAITEKTLKPILLKKPFLVVAEPYFLKYLRYIGFKTFNSIFDESYDNILCPVTRCEKVYKQLEDFCKLSLNDAIDATTKMKYITDYNYDYFYNHLNKTSDIKNKLETYFWKVHKGEINGRN
jgi:hypothetical protein